MTFYTLNTSISWDMFLSFVLIDEKTCASQVSVMGNTTF